METGQRSRSELNLQLQANKNSSKLASRLDTIESKLDKLISLMEAKSKSKKTKE